VSNPTAGQVAAELRKLADALDNGPDVEIYNVYCNLSVKTKESFLAVARALPKPFWKVPDGNEYKLDNRPHGADGRLSYDMTKWPPVHFSLTAPRAEVCRLVRPAQPAEYECDALLTEAEEAALEDSHAR
jgi:hypothetical protein